MTMEEQSKKLTGVQARFVEEYLKDPSDGGEAYMKASGLANKKSASVQASKLLKMPKIQDALNESAEAILGALKTKILKNVEFWLDIRDGVNPGEGKGRMVPLADVHRLLTDHGLMDKELKEDLDSLLTFVVSQLRVADRMKASEYLGKYMQMFIDKKEIDVSGKVQIIDDIK